MTLPAFAAKRRRLQYGARSCRSISAADAGAQQQIRRPPLLLSIDGTDGQTDTRPLHRRCFAVMPVLSFHLFCFNHNVDFLDNAAGVAGCRCDDATV